MSKEQEELNVLVKAVYEAVAKAQEYADKHKLSFGLSLAYGMGGWYEGDPEERNRDHDNGWYASSQGC
jgi:hypothetical protein